MPYLPTADLINTTFPEGQARDVRRQIDFADKLYKRHYPRIDYYPLLKSVTPVAEPTDTSGEPNTTKFDPVWGETLDSGLTEWEQPHDPGGAAASEVEEHGGPYPLHMRVQRGQKDLDLKRYGFDKMRDLTVYTTLKQLDDQGVAVKAGDRFVWDGDSYLVKDFTRTGYLWNTNIRVYMILSCDHERVGS